MHHALRHALTVETLEFLQQLYVLQQHRAVRAGGLGVLVVADRCTVVAGQGEAWAENASRLAAMTPSARRAGVEPYELRDMVIPLRFLGALLARREA